MKQNYMYQYGGTTENQQKEKVQEEYIKYRKFFKIYIA